MPRQSQSFVLSDYTESSLQASLLGLNGSFSPNLSAQDESVLGSSSDLSLQNVLGNLSFNERVKQMSNESNLSIIFPRGSLNNIKLKKKRRMPSNLPTSSNNSNESLKTSDESLSSTINSSNPDDSFFKRPKDPSTKKLKSKRKQPRVVEVAFEVADCQSKLKKNINNNDRRRKTMQEKVQPRKVSVKIPSDEESLNESLIEKELAVPHKHSDGPPKEESGVSNSSRKNKTRKCEVTTFDLDESESTSDLELDEKALCKVKSDQFSQSKMKAKNTPLARRISVNLANFDNSESTLESSNETLRKSLLELNETEIKKRGRTRIMKSKRVSVHCNFEDSNISEQELNINPEGKSVVSTEHDAKVINNKSSLSPKDKTLDTAANQVKPRKSILRQSIKNSQLNENASDSPEGKSDNSGERVLRKPRVSSVRFNLQSSYEDSKRMVRKSKLRKSIMSVSQSLPEVEETNRNRVSSVIDATRIVDEEMELTIRSERSLRRSTLMEIDQSLAICREQNEKLPIGNTTIDKLGISLTESEKEFYLVAQAVKQDRISSDMRCLSKGDITLAENTSSDKENEEGHNPSISRKSSSNENTIDQSVNDSLIYGMSAFLKEVKSPLSRASEKASKSMNKSIIQSESSEGASKTIAEINASSIESDLSVCQELKDNLPSLNDSKNRIEANRISIATAESSIDPSVQKDLSCISQKHKAERTSHINKSTTDAESSLVISHSEDQTSFASRISEVLSNACNSTKENDQETRRISSEEQHFENVINEDEQGGKPKTSENENLLNTEVIPISSTSKSAVYNITEIAGDIDETVSVHFGLDSTKEIFSLSETSENPQEGHNSNSGVNKIYSDKKSLLVNESQNVTVIPTESAPKSGKPTSSLGGTCGTKILSTTTAESNECKDMTHQEPCLTLDLDNDLLKSNVENENIPKGKEYVDFKKRKVSVHFELDDTTKLYGTYKKKPTGNSNSLGNNENYSDSTPVDSKSKSQHEKELTDETASNKECTIPTVNNPNISVHFNVDSRENSTFSNISEQPMDSVQVKIRPPLIKNKALLDSLKFTESDSNFSTLESNCPSSVVSMPERVKPRVSVHFGLDSTQEISSLSETSENPQEGHNSNSGVNKIYSDKKSLLVNESQNVTVIPTESSPKSGKPTSSLGGTCGTKILSTTTAESNECRKVTPQEPSLTLDLDNDFLKSNVENENIPKGKEYVDFKKCKVSVHFELDDTTKLNGTYKKKSMGNSNSLGNNENNSDSTPVDSKSKSQHEKELTDETASNKECTIPTVNNPNISVHFNVDSRENSTFSNISEQSMNSVPAKIRPPLIKNKALLDDSLKFAESDLNFSTLESNCPSSVVSMPERVKPRVSVHFGLDSTQEISSLSQTSENPQEGHNSNSGVNTICSDKKSLSVNESQNATVIPAESSPKSGKPTSSLGGTCGTKILSTTTAESNECKDMTHQEPCLTLDLDNDFLKSNVENENIPKGKEYVDFKKCKVSVHFELDDTTKLNGTYKKKSTGNSNSLGNNENNSDSTPVDSKSKSQHEKELTDETASNKECTIPTVNNPNISVHFNVDSRENSTFSNISEQPMNSVPAKIRPPLIKNKALLDDSLKFAESDLNFSTLESNCPSSVVSMPERVKPRVSVHFGLDSTQEISSLSQTSENPQEGHNSNSGVNTICSDKKSLSVNESQNVTVMPAESSSKSGKPTSSLGGTCGTKILSTTTAENNECREVTPQEPSLTLDLDNDFLKSNVENENIPKGKDFNKRVSVHIDFNSTQSKDDPGLDKSHPISENRVEENADKNSLSPPKIADEKEIHMDVNSSKHYEEKKSTKVSENVSRHNSDATFIISRNERGFLCLSDGSPLPSSMSGQPTVTDLVKSKCTANDDTNLQQRKVSVHFEVGSTKDSSRSNGSNSSATNFDGSLKTCASDSNFSSLGSNHLSSISVPQRVKPRVSVHFGLDSNEISTDASKNPQEIHNDEGDTQIHKETLPENESRNLTVVPAESSSKSVKPSSPLGGVCGNKTLSTTTAGNNECKEVTQEPSLTLNLDSDFLKRSMESEVIPKGKELNKRISVLIDFNSTSKPQGDQTVSKNVEHSSVCIGKKLLHPNDVSDNETSHCHSEKSAEKTLNEANYQNIHVLRNQDDHSSESIEPSPSHVKNAIEEAKYLESNNTQHDMNEESVLAKVSEKVSISDPTSVRSGTFIISCEARDHGGVNNDSPQEDDTCSLSLFTSIPNIPNLYEIHEKLSDSSETAVHNISLKNNLQEESLPKTGRLSVAITSPSSNNYNAAINTSDELEAGGNEISGQSKRSASTVKDVTAIERSKKPIGKESASPPQADKSSGMHESTGKEKMNESRYNLRKKLPYNVTKSPKLNKRKKSVTFGHNTYRSVSSEECISEGQSKHTSPAVCEHKEDMREASRESPTSKSHSFTLPGIPPRKSKEVSETSSKRSRSHTSEQSSSTEESSNTSKRKKGEKTIHELSYDTSLDVSEIPKDKTIINKKLIYHSTPIHPVLDKKKSRKKSKENVIFSTVHRHSDKMIQVSKEGLGMSSEATTLLRSSNKKSAELSSSLACSKPVKNSQELSTSYSSGGLPKRTSKRNGSPLEKQTSKTPRNNQTTSSHEEISPSAGTVESSDDYPASTTYISSATPRWTVRFKQSVQFKDLSTTDESSTVKDASGTRQSSALSEDSGRVYLSATMFSSFSTSSQNSRSNENSRSNRNKILLPWGDASRKVQFISQPHVISNSISTISGNTPSVSSFRREESYGSSLRESRKDSNMSTSLRAPQVQEEMESMFDFPNQNVSVPSLDESSASELPTLKDISLVRQGFGLPTPRKVPRKRGKTTLVPDESLFSKPSTSRYDFKSDPRFTINGEVPGAKMKFPAKWVSKDLYKYILKKIEESLEESEKLTARSLSHQLITHLCATVAAVKCIDSPEDIYLSTLVLRMLLLKHKVCSGFMDFLMFIMDCTPFEFQNKIIPIITSKTEQGISELVTESEKQFILDINAGSNSNNDSNSENICDSLISS